MAPLQVEPDLYWVQSLSSGPDPTLRSRGPYGLHVFHGKGEWIIVPRMPMRLDHQ